MAQLPAGPQPTGQAGTYTVWNYSTGGWERFASQQAMETARSANPAAYCASASVRGMNQNEIAPGAGQMPLVVGTPTQPQKVGVNGSSYGMVHEPGVTPEGVAIERWGENIPLAQDPTQEQILRGQYYSPGRVDLSSQLVRVGPYVVPEDAWIALNTPSDPGRYQQARNIFEGKGAHFGGGDTAPPGTVGRVHVDAAGNAVPNYGRNVMSESPDIYAGTTSYTLIAGSPREGFPGQDLSIPRASMPFIPENLIVIPGMGERGLPSYAIPTSSLSTNNPWDPVIVNKYATEEAMKYTAALVKERPGYSEEMGGKTPAESARLLLTHWSEMAGAMARGDIVGMVAAEQKIQSPSQNLVEWTSTYHHVGQTMGIPIAVNPFEYAGDVAVEFLKGTPTKDSERFSPVSGILMGILPSEIGPGGATHGVGLQEHAWDVAMSRERGQPVTFLDFSKAATFLAGIVRSGDQGPYANLYGGKNYAGVETRRPLGEDVFGPKVHIMTTIQPEQEGRTVGSKMVAGSASLTEVPAALAGLPAPFISTSVGVLENRVSTESPTGKIFGVDIPFISPALAFFQPGTKTETTKTTTQLPEKTAFEKREYYDVPGGVGYTDYYKTASGQQVQERVNTTQTMSEFDKIFESTNVILRDTLGFSKMPEPTTEQIKSTAPYLAIVPGAAPIGMALMTPGTSDYAAEYLKGEIKGVMEKPAQAGLMFGIGILTGGAFKAGEGIYGVGRASIAEKVISEGGIWRGFEQGGNFVMTQGPKILGGLYAADVAIRSTAGGSDLSPASAGRAGFIVATEARPMTAGAIFGYTGTGAVVERSSAAIARIKLELPGFVEEAGGSKVIGAAKYAGYRVGQPVVETAMRPIDLLKQDYRAYAMEKVEKTPVVSLERPSIPDYIWERGFGQTPAAEPITIKSAQKYAVTELGLQPVSTEYGAEVSKAAYGRVGQGRYIQPPSPEVPLLGKKTTVLQGGKWGTKYVEPTAEQTITGEIALKAYGKQPTIVERGAYILETIQKSSAKVPTPVREWYTTAGEALRIEGIDTRKVYGTEPFWDKVDKADIGINAFFQERPNLVRDLTTPLFTPKKGGMFGDKIAKEISDINMMSKIKSDYLKMQRAMVAEQKAPAKPFKKTPLNKTFGFGQPKAKPQRANEPGVVEKEIKTKGGIMTALVKQTPGQVERGLAETARFLGAAPAMAPAARVVSNIEYPSGPSPIRKIINFVEEEEYTYTRVLDKVIQKPDLQVRNVPIQHPVLIPSRGEVSVVSQLSEARNTLASELIPKHVKLPDLYNRETGRDIPPERSVERSDRIGLVDLTRTINITKTSTMQRNVQDQSLKQQQRQDVIQIPEQLIIRGPEPFIPKFPEITIPEAPMGLGGGGGGGMPSILRSRGIYRNPVVDVQYLREVGKNFGKIDLLRGPPAKKKTARRKK